MHTELTMLAWRILRDLYGKPMNKTATERPLHDLGGGEGGSVCTCVCLILLVLFSASSS